VTSIKRMSGRALTVAIRPDPLSATVANTGTGPPSQAQVAQ
jgi:hypothetical protein